MVKTMKNKLGLYENIKDNQRLYINNALINIKINAREKLQKINTKMYILQEKDYIKIILVNCNYRKNEVNLKKSVSISTFNCYYSLEKIKDWLKVQLREDEEVALYIYCLLRIYYIRNNL